MRDTSVKRRARSDPDAPSTVNLVPTFLDALVQRRLCYTGRMADGVLCPS